MSTATAVEAGTSFTTQAKPQPKLRVVGPMSETAQERVRPILYIHAAIPAPGSWPDKDGCCEYIVQACVLEKSMEAGRVTFMPAQNEIFLRYNGLINRAKGEEGLTSGYVYACDIDGDRLKGFNHLLIRRAGKIQSYIRDQFGDEVESRAHEIAVVAAIYENANKRRGFRRSDPRINHTCGA